MPCVNLPITSIGPVLEIGISSPDSLAQSGCEPKIYWVKAIVDTGCSHTAINSVVAANCGLKVVGKDSANNTSGVIAVNIYHGDLVLRPMMDGSQIEWRFDDRRFIELLHVHPEFDALLGMDILNEGLLVTNGLLKQATFCW
jgi:hypothetical protein